MTHEQRPSHATEKPADVAVSEAAAILGLTCEQVGSLVDQVERGALAHSGKLEDQRIRLSSIRAFQQADRRRSQAAMRDLADLQNELGLTE